MTTAAESTQKSPFKPPSAQKCVLARAPPGPGPGTASAQAQAARTQAPAPTIPGPWPGAAAGGAMSGANLSALPPQGLLSQVFGTAFKVPRTAF